MTTIRLLPYAVADGPRNMADDEVLLESAARGVASLRFYGWTTATISLGYFQPAGKQVLEPQVMRLPLVRRTTGGDALVHHHEVTYALALPTSRQHPVRKQWLDMHGAIAAALAEFGIDARPHVPTEEDTFKGFLCFHHFTDGDLLVNGCKVVGSAQRKQRGAVLQHGGILLATSPHTPWLLGLRELTGIALDPQQLRAAVIRKFREKTGMDTLEGDWTDDERRRVEEVAAERYGQYAWNYKR